MLCLRLKIICVKTLWIHLVWWPTAGDLEGLTKMVAADVDLRRVFFPRGRVAMLATMGYIVPEYFRFPGATGFPIYAGTPKSSIYIIGLSSIVHPYWGSPMCIHLWKAAIVNYVVLWMELLMFAETGYCSPSEGVKFADIPNGLAAISKVRASSALLCCVVCSANHGGGTFHRTSRRLRDW